MVQTQIRATGFFSGSKALNEIGEYISSHGIDPFFIQAAQKTTQAQQNLAPIRTGFLRNNIGFMVGRNGADLFINFFSRARYSTFVEYGTFKMVARPFFFPPFFTTLIPELRRANQNVKQKVDMEFRRAAGKP